MTTERGGCSHIEAAETVTPAAARVCEECVTNCYPDDAYAEY